MKRVLTITLIIFLTVDVVRGQTNTDGLIGEYFSIENKFESFSTMILEKDNRFIYSYGIGGCRGEVKGTWTIRDKKLEFKNDSTFLDNKIIKYPDLGQTAWTVKKIGIQPDKIVDSGCVKSDKLHMKRETSDFEYSVSIVRLIANPEKYHNKKIQITGYMNLEFEGDAIYLHKEDYEKSLLTNGFWVSFSDKLDQKEIQKLNKGYVLIEGTFDMNNHGHMGLFGGEVKEITRIIKWGN
ncbi:MAG: hypothetical protein KF803_12090 [Cyclobacteriaceae bacterium]|nr:hypothetical protein [Cyclobacteriaceae bacterium]